MMKKALWAVLAVVFALSFTACRKSEATAKTTGPKYKVGVVFDVGGKGDKSFNDSAYNGLVKLAREFNGYIKDDPANVNFGSEVEFKYLEPKEGGQDREQLLRVMAEDDYNLIFGVGFLFQDALAKVAKEFPNTHFGIIDGYIDGLDETSNITCLGFAEHEGSFLVGAVAGLFAGKNKIGFVGGMDIPLIHKFHGGFFAGAMYVNPDLRDPKKLLGQYIGKDPSAFNDPKTGESIASNMYKQGAAIILHASGGSGSGVFKAAVDAGKLAMGVDSDQGLVYASAGTSEEKKISEHILTSMLKGVDNGIYLTAKDFMEDGKVAGGYKTFGLKEGGVGIAVNDFNKDKLASVLPRIEEIQQKVISGELTVPDSDEKLRDWAAQNLK